MNPWIKLFKFLAILTLPYVFWQLILLFGENRGYFNEILGISLNNETLFRTYWTNFTSSWGVYFVYISEPILNLIGYKTFSYGTVLGLEGQRGVHIARACLGFGSYIIFMSFILAYPAKIKLKLKYAGIGLLAIFALNILRIVVLVIAQQHFPQYMDLIHFNGFRTVLFIMIFIIWAFFYWADSKDQDQNQEPAASGSAVSTV